MDYHWRESWFFFYYPCDSVWAMSHDEFHQLIKQKIDREECFISILWLVNGIHSLLDVPKGTTYNAAFFTDVVLPSFRNSEEFDQFLNFCMKHFGVNAAECPTDCFTAEEGRRCRSGSFEKETAALEHGLRITGDLRLHLHVAPR
jgi:hypothetical protein